MSSLGANCFLSNTQILRRPFVIVDADRDCWLEMGLDVPDFMLMSRAMKEASRTY